MMRYVFLMLSLVIFVHCSPVKNGKNIDKVIISGKIENNKVERVKISNSDTVFEALINAAGEFSMNFDLNEAGYFHYQGNEGAPMYISPGDSLHIRLNTLAFDETMEFSGTGQEVNNYLLHKFLVDEAFIYSNDRAIFELNVEAFIPKIGLLNKIKRNMLEEIKAINSGFYGHEVNILRFEHYALLADYPMMYRQKKGEKPENVIEEAHYNFFAEIDLNNENLLIYDGYEDLLWKFLDTKSAQKVTSGEYADYSYPLSYAKLDVVDEYFTNETIKQKIEKGAILRQISMVQFDDDLMKIVEKRVEEEDFKKYERLYNRLKSLQPGNPAPDFEIFDPSGNKKTLASYKGKYLLLDTWSTNCMPCIREIPLLEKLKEELKGKNIEIVAVCLSEKESWLKKINDLGLEKNQFYAKEGWGSQYKKDYIKNKGVPTFILISPQGKIINARVPKPSEGLGEYLNELGI